MQKFSEAVSEEISLPLENKEQKRDVAIIVGNLQRDLSLQLKVNCDGNQVKLYGLLTDALKFNPENPKDS